MKVFPMRSFLGEIICGFTRLKEMKKIKIKVIKITISFCTMV